MVMHIVIKSGAICLKWKEKKELTGPQIFFFFNLYYYCRFSEKKMNFFYFETVSDHFLNTSGDGDCTTSLGILF